MRLRTRLFPAATQAGRELDAIAHAGAAGAIAALFFVIVDVVGRTRWGAHGAGGYITTTLRIGAAVGATLGGVAVAAARVTALGLRPDASRWRRSVYEVLVALTLGAVVAAPLRGIVLGGALRGSSVAACIPWVGFAGAALGTLAWRVWIASRHAMPVVVSTGAALLLLFLDARAFSGRHHGAHLALETTAFLLLLGSALRALRELRGVASGLVIATGTAALTGGLVWMSSGYARARELAALGHLAHEPSTAATLYRRALNADHRLAARRSVAPKWAIGELESAAEAAESAALRSGCGGNCNVIVYFVDTLRADVAVDPAVMPNLAALAEDAIHFSNAYSTASDTLRALPPLIGGRYDGTTDAGLLRRVRSKKLDNALFIPSSAHEFLTEQVPAFEFDEVQTVADHSPDRRVWGYGADRLTGDAITERALEWMRERSDRRLFAWLYNFDLHGWRELDDARLPSTDRPEARYRAVAESVDRSFGALLDGLRTLGLADRTVIVFVSDHGEALGYRDYWTHSTFLWEPLVRVPLVVRVPGLPPRSIARTVSTVDVTPTLARFVDPAADVGAYHGIDLLRFYAEPDAPRDLPLLMRANSDGKTSVVGAVVDTRKLVMRAEGGPPALHDLSRIDPDDTDLARDEPDVVQRVLEELVSSPLLTAAD